MRHKVAWKAWVLASYLVAGACLSAWGSPGTGDSGSKSKNKLKSKNDVASTWWSFQPLRRPPIPQQPTPDTRHPTPNPIDAFISSRLQKERLTPAAEADRRALIRRASFDLIGLPPTPERVERFVADEDPNAWAKLIDELLASPQYGERWARHWLDTVRYADSGGYETDIYYKNAWRYRDYVVKSLNDDKPYDVFVREQIAGDELMPQPLELEGSYAVPAIKARALEARTGTGLFSFGPQIHESNMDGKLIRSEWLTDCVDTVGSVFMGLTLGCARCHDHKFDPLTQRDYYALQAVFAPSRIVDEPVAHAMAVASNRQHYPRLIAVDEARKAIRLFEQRTAGRTLSPAEQQERSALRDALAQRVLDLPESIPDTPGGPWDGLMDIPTTSVLTHRDRRQIAEVRLLDRGELTRPRETARAAVPAVLKSALPPPSMTDPGTYRKGLAGWLTRPDHPLTARVMVNRVWQWHMGRGLVGTPNDFGRLGQRPTEPQLLDWLACAFSGFRFQVPGPRGKGAKHESGKPREESLGWSLKSLHRLIMLSDAYRRSSSWTDAGNMAKDPQNLLWWRAERRRLEGEAVWDAVHAAAGTLNPKMGGRPVVPPLAEEELTALRDRWQWTVAADPKEHTRRGLYILSRRNFRLPMFEVFDAPVNSVSCPRRDVTTVAPQALWLLNNKVATTQASQFAARLAKENPEHKTWTDRAWRLALGRGPSKDENEEAQQLLAALEAGASDTLSLDAPEALRSLPPKRANALSQFCLSLFNLSEFLYAD
jgi:hypothetical protein